MERDLQDDPNSDPQDYLRQQIMSQLGGGAVPEATPDPVYSTPETPAPPDPSGGYQPPDPSPYIPAQVPQEQGQSVGPDVQPWQAPEQPVSAVFAARNDPNDRNPNPGNQGGSTAPAPQTPAPTGGYQGGGDQSILSLLQQGMSPQQAVQVFNQANGRGYGNEAVYYNDNRGQTIGLPGGYAALTPGGWTWTVRTPEGPAGAQPAVQGAPVQRAPQVQAPQSLQLPTFSSISGGSASGPQGVWNSDFVAQLRQLIMQRLASASTPVDPNSDTIQAPLNAARDEATRTSDKERTALAENLYAQGGLNTDAISQKVQQSGEKNAQGLSSLRATLITREIAQKQDELKSLLQMALQSGDAESAQAIQLQLGELSAQVQREGLGEDMSKYAAYLNALASNSVMA